MLWRADRAAGGAGSDRAQRLGSRIVVGRTSSVLTSLTSVNYLLIF
jgi:hypothetical protein